MVNNFNILFINNYYQIYQTKDTSPEDVGGMWASQGVLTARGGMTSHAAVVISQ